MRRCRLEQLEVRAMLAGLIPVESPAWPETALPAVGDGMTVETGTSHLRSLAGDLGVAAAPFVQRHLFESGEFLSDPSSGDPLEIAGDFLSKRAAVLGLEAAQLEQLRVTDRYVSQHTGVTHIYFRQTLHGLELFGADINVNVAADGRIINAGSRLPQGNGVAPTWQPSLSSLGAWRALALQLGHRPTSVPVVLDQAHGLSQTTRLGGAGLSLDDVPASLHYVMGPNGTAELAWNLVVRTDHDWYDASISTYRGELIRLESWGAHARYDVFASPLRHPDDGARSLVVDPHDIIASPFGWHDTDGTPGPEFTVTRGNNVFAQEDRDGNDTGGARPDGGPSLDFRFPLDLGGEPETYQDAAITNLFYWNNVLHDIHYQYGFDEVAGNFQANNYGRGGVGGDAVLADAQDSAAIGSFNNAFFGTPPDGSQPVLIMREFNRTSPHRDSDLENTIIIHEYGHGVSNRLTGGPSNVGALSALQSRSMGEGWSDWWALMLTQTSADTQSGAYPIGTYVLGQTIGGQGIRRQPYSFDKSIDPLTYGDFNTDNQVHRGGEIWASALWDLNWLLINGDGERLPARGFDPDFYQGTGGNNIALQLVIDGLKLQPADPSFLDGRDAILLADLVANEGANHLAIWTAFARRGMGFSASDGGSGASETVVEAFDLPAQFASGTSAVQGQKWHDLNGNGQRDSGEPGLNGWEIQLFAGPQLVASQTTRDIDLDGSGTIDPETERGLYRFTELTPAVYTVREAERAGWTQTATEDTQTGVWKPLGPAPILHAETPGDENVAGRVVAIAPHPQNEDIVYLGGAQGGVWRTFDGGLNWSPLTDQQVTLATGALAIAPSDPNVIYAGTGEANFSADSFHGRGVLKSTDGGESWTLLGQAEFARRSIAKVVVHPTDPNTVYVAVGRGVNGLAGNQGVWKSVDGGSTWTNTTAALGSSVPITDLLLDPTSPATVWAGFGEVFGNASNGLYRSIDAGASWHPVGVGLLPAGLTAGRVTLAISPNGLTVYAAWQDAGVNFGALLGFFQSTDGGTTWTDRTAGTPNYMGSQGWNSSALAVDPNNASRVFAGGAGGANSLLRSDDGGASWADISVGTDGNGPHANHHALVFAADGTLLDGTDGGLWRTGNQGGLWDNLNTDLSLTQFYDVAVHPTNDELAYGGTQGNGTIQFAGTAGWNQLAGGDGGVVQVDSRTPSTIYQAFQYSGPGFLRRSDDSGASFDPKTGGVDTTDPGRFIVPYELDPSDPTRLVLGTDRVYLSSDRGDSWTAISPVLGGGVVATLDVAASDGDTIYVGYTDGSLFATFDGGANWARRDTGLPGPPASGIHSGPNFGDPTGPELVPAGLSGALGIADIAIDPVDNLTVYAARDTFGSGSVWRTTDGGTAWTDISGNLPALPAHAIVLDPRPDPDVLYLGLDDGVYQSLDQGATWQRYGEGVPNTAARDLEINLELNRLTVGTHGRGAWTVEIDDPQAWNIKKLSRVSLEQIPGGSTRANDVTGYVSPGGVEYAIIGLQKGTGFVDLSDPLHPSVVAFVAGADESSSRSAESESPHHAHPHARCHDGCEGASTWRDVKTVGQYAYVTNETGGGFQVIDLTAIDSGTVTALGSLTQDGLLTAHNVGVNPESGFAFLVGANIANGGIVAVDLADPANLQIAGTWAETYVHDIEIVSYTSGDFAGREIAYAFAAGVGVVVVDVTDKANMFTVATETYPNLAYTHYGALSEDLRYLFVNDELDEVRANVPTTTTYIMDVSNPADPVYLTSFTTGLTSIDHNLRVRGDFLFEANYRSGLHVFDISDIGDVREVGQYDTFPSNDKAHFSGAWGVYSGLPSGVVLISDIESGLFVLDASHAQGQHLVVLDEDETVEGINFGNYELPTVQLTVDQAEIAEDAGVATFTATLSAPALLPVIIDLSFAGTAAHGDDFIVSAAQILIAVGESAGSATVTATQDSLAEADETVIVEIVGASNAALSGTQQQSTTIRDDDPAPIATALEVNGSGNTNRSAIAQLTLSFDQPVNVDSADSLRLINQTTGAGINISAATLKNNGTAAVSWILSGVELPAGRYSAELLSTDVASLHGKPLAATSAFLFHVLPGDSNGDGFVGFPDFSDVAQHFNTINGPILGPGDLNADGSVDFGDFGVLAANFNVALSELSLDFGDASESETALPSTLANDGARHVLGSDLYLGASVDPEADGQPDASALGDDNAGDDEDGVSFGPLRPGNPTTLVVTANVPSGTSAVLNAWIDFNGDGDWDDDAEHVLVDQQIVEGTSNPTISVPSAVAQGQVYARFRITHSPGYTYRGLAPAGEVEDYRVAIEAAGRSLDSSANRFQLAAVVAERLRLFSKRSEAENAKADEPPAATTHFAVEAANERSGHTPRGPAVKETDDFPPLLDARLVDQLLADDWVSSRSERG